MSILYNMLRRSMILVTMLLICFFSVSAEQFTIVIDAGHGGKDVGAVDNQVKEKDINLAVALELGSLIKKKLDDVKVVYTRDKDTYLTLQQRAEKANKANGDLFVSIHTNSVAMSNKNRRTVCGASTYTLGLHKDDENMEVARRENAVMTLEKDFQTTYQGFNPNSDESYIIFELSQKKNMSQSIKLANDIQKQLASVANRQDRGVHQAGFWVLWATSMPAVLVELDFICNPISAKYLASENGQKQLAKGIFNAIKNYYGNIKAHSAKTAQNEDEEALEEENVSDFSAQVVIGSNNHDNIKRKKTPEQSKSSTQASNSNGKRRRRSMESKQASEQQTYDVAVIKERKQPYYQINEGDEITIDDVEVEKESANDNILAINKGNNDNTSKKLKSSVEKKVDVKETLVASNNSKQVKSASVEKSKKEELTKQREQKVTKSSKTELSKKDSKRSSKAKLNKRTTVYKIHILTSDEQLRAGDERFCGLKPIKCKLRDGKYLYTYGESENEKEMENLLKTVIAKIPDAYVMKDSKIVK